MHLNRRLSAALATALVATAGVVSSAPPADASLTCGSTASVNIATNLGQTLIVCHILEGASNVPSAPTALPVDWKPPLCWLEPQYTGPQLKAFLDSQMAIDPPYVTALETFYGSTNPPYQGTESGWFWGVGCRLDDMSFSSALPAQWAADGLSADNPWVWIPAGAPVHQPDPVTPLILAEYAAAEVVPPALTFDVNPGVLQTVNLSTRVFYANAGPGQPGPFKELEAEAQIANMDSKVMATPSSVTITPGGPASRTLGGPSVDSITCPIVNGSFGNKDDDTQADSCFFYYTKATAKNESYPLKVSITWTYTWEGHPNAPGWPVRVTVDANPQDVTVQEVQAIVGGQQP